MFACKLASSTLLLMAHCDLVVRYPQQMPIKGKPTAGCVPTCIFMCITNETGAMSAMSG